MRYLACFMALLLYSFLASVAPLEAKGKISKEVEKLGRELQKETALFFDTENFLEQDDLVSKREEGQTFNYEKPPENPLEKDITSAASRGQYIEGVDSAETFLQRSWQISSNSNESSFLEEENTVTKTCVEHISKVSKLLQHRETAVVPEITETKKVCPGHQHSFMATFNTKKSISELTKNIEKNHGSNIVIQGKLVDGRNVIVSYKHLNPEIKDASLPNGILKSKFGCFGAKTETIILNPREEIITWNTENEKELKYLEQEPTCHLISKDNIDENTRSLVYRCESGSNEKCQAIRDAGGILKDQECLEYGPEGRPLRYLKTFSFPAQKPAPQEYFLDDQELFDLEDFETVSEPDSNFARIVSYLAGAFSGRGASETTATDPMKTPIFPGKVSSCKRGCSSRVMYDCCSDPRGLLTHVPGVIGAHCTRDEVKLKQKRDEGKCHYVGTRDRKLGLEKEQVYICYPDVLSRVIQEEAHHQLNLDWGTAEEPKEKSLILEQLSQLNFEIMDMTDIEKELMGKIDQDAIMSKIKNTAGSFDQAAAKRQTESFIKEDRQKCFD